MRLVTGVGGLMLLALMGAGCRTTREPAAPQASPPQMQQAPQTLVYPGVVQNQDPIKPMPAGTAPPVPPTTPPAPPPMPSPTIASSPPAAAPAPAADSDGPIPAPSFATPPSPAPSR